MALAATVTKHWDDGKVLHVVGTIAASGNYVASGDALSFVNTAIKSSRVPVHVEVHGIALGTAYSYRFVPGATQAAGLMLVILVSTGAELAAGAYPAGVTGDTIRFYALFQKLV